MTIEVYVNNNYEAKTREDAISEIQEQPSFFDWCVDSIGDLLTGQEIFEHLDIETSEKIKELATEQILNNEYYYNIIEV